MITHIPERLAKRTCVLVAAALALPIAACSEGGKRPLGARCGDDGDCASGLCLEGACVDPATVVDPDVTTRDVSATDVASETVAPETADDVPTTTDAPTTTTSGDAEDAAPEITSDTIVDDVPDTTAPSDVDDEAEVVLSDDPVCDTPVAIGADEGTTRFIRPTWSFAPGSPTLLIWEEGQRTYGSRRLDGSEWGATMSLGSGHELDLAAPIAGRQGAHAALATTLFSPSAMGIVAFDPVAGSWTGPETAAALTPGVLAVALEPTGVLHALVKVNLGARVDTITWTAQAGFGTPVELDTYGAGRAFDAVYRRAADGDGAIVVRTTTTDQLVGYVLVDGARVAGAAALETVGAGTFEDYLLVPLPDGTTLLVWSETTLGLFATTLSLVEGAPTFAPTTTLVEGTAARFDAVIDGRGDLTVTWVADGERHARRRLDGTWADAMSLGKADDWRREPVVDATGDTWVTDRDMVTNEIRVVRVRAGATAWSAPWVLPAQDGFAFPQAPRLGLDPSAGVLLAWQAQRSVGSGSHVFVARCR